MNDNIYEAALTEEKSCPECESPSDGTYCPHCGEQMETHLFSVKHYIKEIFQEFAVFDTKFFRTIPALLFKPGFLSVEYLAGRRKRYLAPARLYILIAFFSFFALGFYLNHKIIDAAQSQAKSNGNFQVYFGEEKGEKAVEHAQTLLKFVTEVSPYVLLLGSTPLFALFLKLIYRRRRMLFAEHLVFSLHFYAFSLIVLIGSAMLEWQYLTYIGGVIFLVYLYFALRRYYSDRGYRLLIRFIACIFAYLNIAIFAIALTLGIAFAIGYQTGDFTKPPKSIHWSG